jgi:hypothetical protein
MFRCHNQSIHFRPKYIYLYIVSKRFSLHLEQNPSSEPDSDSSSQEILYLSCNPKVHHSVHNSLPLAPVLSHMNLFHTLNT